MSGSVGEVHATNFAGGSAIGYYHLQGPSAFSRQSWTFSTVAPSTGSYAYEWDYSGLHSYFQVYAALSAFGGLAGASTALYAPAVQDCCTSPSNGFSEQGVYDFGLVQAGEAFGFVISGRNHYATRLLEGQLSVAVAAVPEPSTWAMAGLGLAMLGWHGGQLRRRDGLKPQG